MKNINKLILAAVPFTMLLSCKGGYSPADPADKEYSYEEFKTLVTNYYRPDYIKNKYKGNNVITFHSFVSKDTDTKDYLGGKVSDLKTPEPAYEGDIPVFSAIYEWDNIPTGWAAVAESPVLSPDHLAYLTTLKIEREEKEVPVFNNFNFKTIDKHFVVSYGYNSDFITSDAIFQDTFNKDMMPYEQATLSETTGNTIDRFFYYQ